MAEISKRDSEIIGTADDGTLTVEGEGAEEVMERTMPKGTGYDRQQSGNTTPGALCAKYGHKPKYYKASDDQEYEVTPRVCRFCQVPM